MAWLSIPFKTQYPVPHFSTKESLIPGFTLQSVVNKSKEDTVASARLLRNMENNTILVTICGQSITVC